MLTSTTLYVWGLRVMMPSCERMAKVVLLAIASTWFSLCFCFKNLGEHVEETSQMTKDRLNCGNPEKGTVQTKCARSFSSQFIARAMASPMSCRCALHFNLFKLGRHEWFESFAFELELVVCFTFVPYYILQILFVYLLPAPSWGVGFGLHFSCGRYDTKSKRLFLKRGALRLELVFYFGGRPWLCRRIDMSGLWPRWCLPFGGSFHRRFLGPGELRWIHRHVQVHCHSVQGAEVTVCARKMKSGSKWMFWSFRKHVAGVGLLR